MPTERTIWPDLLTPDERAQLDRPTRHLPAQVDVLVVGGGIVGLAAAAMCQRAGLGSVLVVERGQLAAGATRGAAGNLVPEAHVGVDPPWLVELMRSSLDLWRELDASWPGGVGLQDVPWLALEPESKVPRARTLSRDEVRALLPWLANPRSAGLVEHQARVNPVRAAVRLAAGLGCVATGTEALEVRVAGGRVATVTTSVGEVEPQHVIFATGGPPRLRGLTVDIPAGWVKGHLIATEPTSLRVPGYVTPLVGQIEDGRLLVGSSVDPGDQSPDVRPDVIAHLWSSFTSELSTATPPNISHQWCCFRPWHPDSIAIVDRVPGTDNAWFTSGHYKTGVLMAPITGQLLAHWIASGARLESAAPLTAARFQRV